MHLGVHKKCSGPKRLYEDPNYRCSTCQGTAPPIDEDHRREVSYLGDMLSTAGGCELSTTCENRLEMELLPVLSFRHVSYKTLGCVYSSCFRIAMHHESILDP